MDLNVSGFDWDHGNRQKCQKHGVSIAGIEGAFRGPIAVFPDPEHSAAEERFKAIGQTSAGRAILVVFTIRQHLGKRLIRPLSARYMHLKEVEYYEAESARTR
jgi:uncharacterized DUF497 family protein